MTENSKNTVKSKRGPYRSQLVSRGDVSHARATDEVQGIVTDETTEAADQKELEALGTILKGEAPGSHSLAASFASPRTSKLRGNQFASG